MSHPEEKNPRKGEKMFMVQIKVTFVDESSVCVPVDGFDSKADAMKFLQEEGQKIGALSNFMMVSPHEQKNPNTGEAIREALPTKAFLSMLRIRSWTFGMFEIAPRSKILKPDSGLIIPGR